MFSIIVLLLSLIIPLDQTARVSLRKDLPLVFYGEAIAVVYTTIICLSLLK